jgi:hypothetical protein
MSEWLSAPRRRDDDRPAGLGWLSVGGALLFAVLLAVHVANKPGVWSPDAAPAKAIAQPTALAERAPS